MESSVRKLLVVDDEETLCELLSFNLKAEGFLVDVAYSAEEALRKDIADYSLIVLDVMMGEMSGFEMARRLRADSKTAGIPIIFCTAKSEEDDMVAGLELGGDDYIVKPFSFRNLLARIHSVLRRVDHNNQIAKEEDVEENVLTFEGISVDRQLKLVTVDGEVLTLPRKEYEILMLLMDHPGVIFSRSEILQRVWDDEVIVLDRTVDVNITRLRRKLGKYGTHIITRSGYGYGLQA